jgi:hypothetical protein
MHPEVKKFWEGRGYSIQIDIAEGVPPDDFHRFWWAAIGKDPNNWEYIARSEPVPPGTKEALCSIYYFYGKCFNEHEMLRIIRLKAFL